MVYLVMTLSTTESAGDGGKCVEIQPPATVLQDAFGMGIKKSLFWKVLTIGWLGEKLQKKRKKYLVVRKMVVSLHPLSSKNGMLKKRREKAREH